MLHAHALKLIQVMHIAMILEKISLSDIICWHFKYLLLLHALLIHCIQVSFTSNSS